MQEIVVIICHFTENFRRLRMKKKNNLPKFLISLEQKKKKKNKEEDKKKKRVKKTEPKKERISNSS